MEGGARLLLLSGWPENAAGGKGGGEGTFEAREG